MKNKKNIKIILGDICYPKAEALIIPANTVGIMDRGILKRIVKDGWKLISIEAKKKIKKDLVEIENCFTTGPGRLKRRGVKKIYHCVIKKFPSDYTSINLVRKALQNTFSKVVEDKMERVTICAIGIEEGELDKKTAARILFEICIKYKDQIEIKIMDSDEEFINYIYSFYEESNEHFKRKSFDSE